MHAQLAQISPIFNNVKTNLGIVILILHILFVFNFMVMQLQKHKVYSILHQWCTLHIFESSSFMVGLQSVIGVNRNLQQSAYPKSKCYFWHYSVIHTFFLTDLFIQPPLLSSLARLLQLQLISYKRYLECTLVQWRLYLSLSAQVAKSTFFMKSPV